MPTNFTENYQLSQWVKSDQVKMEDFNADNAKIDAALASHAAALAGKGNCQIWTTGYSGSGGYGSTNARSLSFPRQPKVVFIFGNHGLLVLAPDMNKGFVTSLNGGTDVTVSWSGNSVSWYNGNTAWAMMNASGTAYQVVALM